MVAYWSHKPVGRFESSIRNKTYFKTKEDHPDKPGHGTIRVIGSSNHYMIRELMGFCRVHNHWNVEKLNRIALG